MMMMQGKNPRELTVLERQRSKLLKWQQGHGTTLFQQPSFYDGGGGGLPSVVNLIHPAPGIECWPQPDLPFVDGGHEVSCGSISRTASCPPAAAAASSGGMKPAAMAAVAEDNSGSFVKKGSFKKRKLERAQSMKVCDRDDAINKKIKVSSDETVSKNTEQSGNNCDAADNNTNNKDVSAATSKDNSKLSEAQKLDYIHVRARRGQATDSHSLAERVRREKISERMKFLQDLVPGCNKVTGKAGMLDEIINYVQSLQRQVEFLSMKLAAVNPSLGFDIEDLFPKEMIPACNSSFPPIDLSSELTNQTYLHFDPIVSCSSLGMGMINSDMGIERTTRAPAPVENTFIDSSCFAHSQPGPMWDTDFQNLYNYQPHQQYLGSIEATNMKMEI